MRFIVAIQILAVFCCLVVPEAVAAGVETWHVRASGSGTVYFKITHGKGRFVASGQSSIIYSDDCVSWSNGSVPYSDNFTDVYFDGATFWVAGYNDATLLSSSDGENWTFLSTGEPADHEHYSAVVQGNGMVVTGGNQTATYDGDIFYSSDGGLNFTPVQPPDLDSLEDVIFVDGSFIAGGRFFDGVGPSDKIYLSDDGITWNEVITGFGTRISALAYGDNLIVAVGEHGIITSSDGLVWTQRVSGEELYGIAWGNGCFVAVGLAGKILTSKDGITWTQQASGTSYHLRDVGFGDDTFFAVGQNDWADDLYVILQSDQVPFFEDGFETSDTSRWSSTVGD
ncbi:MAG: hypothetical protein K8R59_01560 [Thermoanaerobaculales bacterium]|nr:hypothetical protein [Thermoanaerobaculales bacterium]